MTKNPALILASHSPRRQQLLALGGWRFDISPADVDERPIEGEDPEQYVLRVAEAKAHKVKETISKEKTILAADTTVVHDGEILGKPADAEEARNVLQRLRDQSHQVYTAISIYDPASNQFFTDLACTDVPMRNYSDDEIERYIATGDPFDKAGSYAIQHPEFHPVDALEGCYANVVGLPLCHVLRRFNKINIQSHRDLPTACQNELGYDCPISQQVLRGNL